MNEPCARTSVLFPINTSSLLCLLVFNLRKHIAPTDGLSAGLGPNTKRGPQDRKPARRVQCQRDAAKTCVSLPPNGNAENNNLLRETEGGRKAPATKVSNAVQMWKICGPTRSGKAEPIPRDQHLRCERGHKRKGL